MEILRGDVLEWSAASIMALGRGGSDRGRGGGRAQRRDGGGGGMRDGRSTRDRPSACRIHKQDSAR
ncbi:hypothetical protein F7R25_30085 [Burkholderia stagnalis]|uniref:Uncharacterized protein n=1 Tax=Burkholderia stagnalis TaxID=1503054 RepID=A0A6L3MPG6_9BURK|nr:hypothetical protein F7R25_30085 [Burkholderia stagnalis]